MKKHTKMIIGVSAAVIALGIVLTIILLLPSDDYTNVNIGENNDILLFDKTALQVDDITVKNSSGEYQLLGYDYTKMIETSNYQNITMIYTMQGYENSLLSKLMTDNLVSECQTVAATRLIDKSGKKYADYGLDKPSAEVNIIYSDSSQIKLSFGSEAPDKSGTYCRIDGDKNVYLVNTGSVDMFFMDKLQLFEKSLTNAIGENEDIAGISISGTGYEKPVVITDEKNIYSMGQYIMTSPYRELCDRSVTVNVGTEFFGMTMTTVAAAEAVESDLAGYGLAEPYMDIRVTTTENTVVHLLVSEKGEDNTYYIMKAGGTIIYAVEEDIDEYEWYGIGYREFLDRESIFNPVLDNTNKITISYNGNIDEYTFERKDIINDLYEETKSIEMYYNGEKKNYGNLSNFMTNISRISREGEIPPESVEGYKEILHIRAEFMDGTADTFILYESSDGKMTAVLNDHIEDDVDTAYARQVMAQIEKIPTEENVVVMDKEEDNT